MKVLTTGIEGVLFHQRRQAESNTSGKAPPITGSRQSSATAAELDRGLAMSREIPLTQGKVAIVDDTDYEWLNQWKWYCVHNRGRYYAVRSHWNKTKKVRERIHIATAIMTRLLGRKPVGFITDHISGDGLDNRRSNLRFCTHKQNGRNRRKQLNSSSRYKGVTWHPRNEKWQTSIKVDGHQYYLGQFVNERAAAQAYNDGAVRHFGEFARLNVFGKEVPNGD